MSFQALKSSSHKDRTPKDPKTERAYHLLRFIGTDRDAHPPSFTSAPIAKRELVLPPQITEEDRRNGFDKSERKPGETQEAYEIRLRYRNKKRKEEWKWVVEGQVQTSASTEEHIRYEGTEDLTQTSNYIVLIPDEGNPGHYKVALLDHWVDLRKHFDNSEAKARLEEERKRKIMRARAQENELEGKLLEEDRTFTQDKMFSKVLAKNSAKQSLDRSFTWVRGREEEDFTQTKRYRETGVVDDDQADDYGSRRRAAAATAFGGGSKSRFGQQNDNDDDDDADGNAVDHNNMLAIDRMGLDPDEFGEADHDFQDDDDGANEDLAEGMEGLQEGEEIAAQAVLLEANRQVGDDEEDDEDPMRAQSPYSSDSDNEDNNTNKPAGKQRMSVAPLLQAATRTAAAAPPPATMQAKPKPMTPRDELKEFIIREVRMNNAKVDRDKLFKEILNRALRSLPGFDKALVPDVIQEVLTAEENTIEGMIYLLKKEYM